MRKFVLFILVALFVVVPHLNAERGFEYYGNLGGSFLLGPEEAADFYHPGYTFGLGFGYRVNPTITLLGYIDVSNHGLNEDEVYKKAGVPSAGLSIDGFNLSIVSIFANIKYNLVGSDSRTNPYLYSGIGFSRLWISDGVISGGGISVNLKGEDSNNFATAFGVGIDFAIGKMNLFADVGYVTRYENKKTEIMPMKIGIRF